MSEVHSVESSGKKKRKEDEKTHKINFKKIRETDILKINR